MNRIIKILQDMIVECMGIFKCGGYEWLDIYVKTSIRQTCNNGS